MKIEEIEKELERGIFEFKSDDDDIDPQYLAEWAEEYGKKLLAVAQAAKEFDKQSKWLDGLITQHEDLRKALEDLEK